jgi:hypothetical protein
VADTGQCLSVLSGMSRRAVSTIAGVEIRVCARVRLFDLSPSLYSPFLSPCVSQERTDCAIDVEVLTERCPPTDLPVVFESGIAWMMQEDEDGYRLNFHKSDTGLIHTVARSDTGTTYVRIYVQQDAAPPESVSPGSLHDQLPSPVSYPLDQLLLMNHLSLRGGIIVHAAGAVVGGKALIFAGASGGGKSTISRSFMDAGLGDSLLSDDRVVLRAEASGRSSRSTGERGHIVAWGTPWAGDAQVARNASASLGALLFLVKGQENELVSLHSGAAMRRLMPVVSCPWYDSERLPGVLDTCSRIVEAFPCYDLRFRPGGEVVALLNERTWDLAGGR